MNQNRLNEGRTFQKRQSTPVSDSELEYYSPSYPDDSSADLLEFPAIEAQSLLVYADRKHHFSFEHP